EVVMSGPNFLREVFCHTKIGARRIRAEHHEKVAIVLPDRFSPRNVKDDEQRGHLYSFVETIVEAAVYANSPYEDFKAEKESGIKEVTFVFFGEPDRALDGFFKTAISDGEAFGLHIAKTRRLIEMPPNLKTPLCFISEILGSHAIPQPSKRWQAIGSPQGMKAHVLWGRDALKAHGFNLMNAVHAGSAHEPCLLKLHYKPKTERQKRVRKVVLTGKGVLFDTGGYDLKGASEYDYMHYDMAGAATVLAIPFLARELNLPVEIIALAPIVQNMIGGRAMLPGSIVRAYGGKTVKITDTDAEGRLILAEAIAFGEKKFKPDAIVSVGTLGNTEDFGPDFLKVGVYGPESENRAWEAARLSAEKIVLLPSIEQLNKVDEAHAGDDCDLVNYTPKKAYHTAPFVFLFNFLEGETDWFFVDNSILMGDDAQEYGVGPGFGVKFVWHIVKQFA
ncbi:MAG: M17 family metallopeptidase, partial [Patescibacteria group bacterium]